MVNIIRRVAEEVQFGSEDVWLSVTSPTFDISVLELFVPLAAGGRVCLARRDSLTTRTRFERLLARSEATVVQATPSQWRVVVSTGWTGAAGLRILCGGEVLSSALARELCGRCDRVWNLYGPTEATIWATAEPLHLDHQVPADGGAPSIGRPFGNLSVYVLDRWMRPLPAGTVGEIFIGGVGMARGYRDAPGLTAESFVPDPFGANPARRMYRTGDFGSFARNGALQFVGRRDDQVKIRGHRVEIPEVEATVRTFAALDNAAVAVRRFGSTAAGAPTVQDAFGGDALVAYGVPAEGRHPTLQELRDFLQDKLPNYMVPSRLVLVDALPLTTSGKLDRKRLAELPMPEHERSDVFVPPRTDDERLLAKIWADVLGVDRVGVDDNFFGLGGDSIQAVIVLTRARECGLEIGVAQLFRTPTVAELAKTAAKNPDRPLPKEAVSGWCPIPPSLRPVLATTGDGFADLRTLALFPVPVLGDPRAVQPGNRDVAREPRCAAGRRDSRSGWLDSAHPRARPVRRVQEHCGGTRRRHGGPGVAGAGGDWLCTGGHGRRRTVAACVPSRDARARLAGRLGTSGPGRSRVMGHRRRRPRAGVAVPAEQERGCRFPCDELVQGVLRRP